LVGFLICLFSLINAFGLVYLDRKAEKENPNTEQVRISEDEQFKWSDIYGFQTSFWILTGSCVLTYMSVFPYIQVASDLLQSKYHFDKVHAGYLFGVPYIISACLSPILGLTIDHIGKRALLICLSSVILTIAYGSSMMMPECNQCYNEMYPLVLVGVGYSIYAAAIWGSIPYLVTGNTVGTAFGIATAIQNIGLVVSPTLVGIIKDRTKHVDHGYFWVNAYFVGINIIGFMLNLSLYYIDIYHNNSVLDKIDQSGE
jgi:MFS family permease